MCSREGLCLSPIVSVETFDILPTHHIFMMPVTLKSVKIFGDYSIRSTSRHIFNWRITTSKRSSFR